MTASPRQLTTTAALRELDLSDMDAALLALAILKEAAAQQIPTDLLCQAMDVAEVVHLDDTRPGNATRPIEPYIAHPLRNTLRLIRYGCTDPATLAAAALHDTVEDHPADLIHILGGSPDEDLDAVGLQNAALELLGERFGAEVAEIVKAVTNSPKPAGLSGAEKNRLYADHVEGVLGKPQVFLVKFSDYVDNAGSVHHIADEGKRERLSQKYLPLVDIFRRSLDGAETPIPVSEDGHRRIREHLDRIRLRLS